MASEADRAVIAIRRARERGDVDYIIGVVRHGDIEPRRIAAAALGRLEDPRGIVPLLRCLDARDERLRVTAIHALGKIGDPSVTGDLFPIASSPGPWSARATAIEALARLDDRRAIAMLAEIVVEPDFDANYVSPSQYPRVSGRPARRWATKKLIEYRGDEAIPLLVEALPKATVARRWPMRRLLRRLQSVQAGRAPRHRPSIGDALTVAWAVLVLAVLLAAIITFIVVADTLGRIIGVIVLVGAIAFAVHVARRLLVEMSQTR